MEVISVDSEAVMQTAYLDDVNIIELYWQRDENAIHETDSKYGKMLFAIAFNVLHDKSDCEECQNDTYLKTWNSIPPTRPTVFPAFLSKIMRDTAINKYKEKKSKKRIPAELTLPLEDLDTFLHGAESPIESAEELGKLINSFALSLTERQRYIFIEHYYLSSTLEAVARELGVGLATVHRETEKIKKSFKKYIDRNGVCI